MTTTIDPPQTPPVPPVPPLPGGSGPTPPSPPRGSSKVIAILVACFGGLVVLGAVGSAVFGAVATGAVHTSTRTADAYGITQLDADISASSFEIVYADVADAELSVRGASGADRWTLERDGDTLVVKSPDGWFGGFGWWGLGGVGDGTLTLPRSVDGLSAELALSAGDFRADGSFDELDLEISAGRADIEGQASELSVDVSAGRADLDLRGVREASLTVSAGELNTIFTGRQPDTIGIDVSAGALHATVPAGDYDVTSDVSAGGFDNEVRSVPDARSVIDVSLSAGQVTLRADG